jgi:hypothetical protein
VTDAELEGVTKPQQEWLERAVAIVSAVIIADDRGKVRIDWIWGIPT